MLSAALTIVLTLAVHSFDDVSVACGLIFPKDLEITNRSEDEKKLLAALASQGLHVNEEELSSLQPGDPRPAYNYHVVSVSNYSLLDTNGSLTLVFFNARLSELIFYPQPDPETFFRRVARILGDRSSSPSVSSSCGVIDLISGSDIRGKKYLSFRKKPVFDALQRWIDKYS